jgi:hypothetical protein
MRYGQAFPVQRKAVVAMIIPAAADPTDPHNSQRRLVNTVIAANAIAI